MSTNSIDTCRWVVRCTGPEEMVRYLADPEASGPHRTWRPWDGRLAVAWRFPTAADGERALAVRECRRTGEQQMGGETVAIGVVEAEAGR